MTTQTPLQVALDQRIPPIVEQIERLRRDCGLQYLADVCTEHANALAELAQRAEGNDVGGTNCIPHFLASLGALDRDMVRVEVASTGLANILALTLKEMREEAKRDNPGHDDDNDELSVIDTLSMTFGTRLATRYPHFDAVAFLRSAGVNIDHHGDA
ncbi:hypothetical protein C8N24_0336 [Solirubrobacter pauli]|uniref:Uncharacterized protein n=1 Tax=Solirubrobacter pauli TaxID=166793 RepID=A0A660LCW0_9ACTN|nr:hypothetical protein [Solirubrobacter pauli]RKQ90531.1 hypothetical protein C8N24_0336 [Solirubrobacter pauli]